MLGRSSETVFQVATDGTCLHTHTVIHKHNYLYISHTHRIQLFVNFLQSIYYLCVKVYVGILPTYFCRLDEIDFCLFFLSKIHKHVFSSNKITYKALRSNINIFLFIKKLSPNKALALVCTKFKIKSVLAQHQKQNLNFQ